MSQSKMSWKNLFKNCHGNLLILKYKFLFFIYKVCFKTFKLHLEIESRPHNTLVSISHSSFLHFLKSCNKNSLALLLRQS